MKKLYFLFFGLFTLLAFGQKSTKSIGFIENKGQIVDQKGKSNQSALYLLNTNGLNVQLRNNGFSYDIYETKKIPLTKKDKDLHPSNTSIVQNDKALDFSIAYRFHRIDIDFLNSNPNATLQAEDKSTDFGNYYNVVHARQGITNVYKYQKVTYQNIYNHIDVVFFIPKDSTKAVEYNFVVKPDGKVSDIQMQFKGAKTELADSKIKMSVRFGEMEETLPLSWEEHGESRKEIAVGFKKIKKNVYGFEGDVNVSGKTMVIDPTPVRLWGTYYGGSADEMCSSLEVDNNDNVFISGSTSSSDNIATAGSSQSVFTGSAGFIAKLDSNGVRIWGSYYPFMGNMKLDKAGNIYLFGRVLTHNPNIPSLGCFQNTKGSFYDGFLIKLDNLGFKQWGTYYGGNGIENIYNVIFDSNNNSYLVGETNSTDVFSTPGAHQEQNQTSASSLQPFDGFIAKFTPQGNRSWGTFYGGYDADAFYSAQVTDDNFLYLVGGSRSTNNIATPDALQSNLSGAVDGIIIKFTLDGQRISGTYAGGPGDDVFLNSKLIGNSLFLSGRTSSSINISTPNTFLENLPSITFPGDTAYFIMNYNIVTKQKEWGTYFFEQIISVDVNENKEVYFAGETDSYSGISTPDAYKKCLQ